LEYCAENKCDICQEENGSGFPWIDGRCYGFTERLYDALALLESQEPITGETSDGYHTFNELYHHRAVLFSVIVANYKDRAWKSVRHHDGTMYDGMFIVGIDTPDGQATYHYDIDPYWDMFDCKVREFAPEWDGHTPAQAIERIGKLKAQEPRILTVSEIGALANGDVVWVELTDGRLLPMMVEDGCLMRWSFLWRICEDAFYGEDYKARAWTSRPTDEQREVTPWN
jgi:hypothetical protein